MLPKDQIRDLKKMLKDRFIDLREEIRLELLESDDQTYIALAGLVHDTGEASVADLLVDLGLAILDHVHTASALSLIHYYFAVLIYLAEFTSSH